MKRLRILWILLLISIAGKAQSPLDVSVKTILGGQEISYMNYGISMAYPIYRSERVVIASGINTDWYHNIIQNDSIGLNNLYKVSIPIIFQVSLNESYKLNLVAAPSLSSDFEDITGSDFSYNGAIRIARDNKNGFSWSAGIGISKQFFGIQVVPFYQANIPLSQRLSLSGTLPMRPRLTFQINKERQVGFALAASAASFRLSAAKNEQYTDIKQGEAFFFYQQKLAGNFYLGLDAGHTFINRIRVFEEDQRIPLRLFLYDFGHQRTPSTSWSHNGWIFQIQITYKLHTP